MRAKRSGLLVALALLAGGLAGCGGDSDTEAAAGGAKIVIGSLDSPESEVLARIYGEALKSAGATVEYRLRLADAEVVVPALEEGRIDMVPAYLGDFLVAVDPSRTRGLSTLQALGALEGAVVHRGLTVAEPSSAAKSEVIAVTKDVAANQSLRKISDLTKLPPPIVLAGPLECAIRQTCLIGLRETYGLDVALTPTNEEGGPLTKAALQEGQAQIGRLFSSDPEAASGGKYVVLEDDKVVQLPGNIVPILRTAKTSPAILEVVNKVSEALTTEKLAGLNEKIIEENAAPAAVAAGFAGTATH